MGARVLHCYPEAAQRHLRVPQRAVNIDRFQGAATNKLRDIASGTSWPLAPFLHAEDNFSIPLYPFFKNLTHLHRVFMVVVTAGISSFARPLSG